MVAAMGAFRPALLLIVVVASGCTLLDKFRPVHRTVARMTGPIGWYRVTQLLAIDSKDHVTIPPREKRSDDEPEQEDDEDYDLDTPLEERVQVRFGRQLSPLLLDPQTPCSYLDPEPEPGRPVFVLVHGIRGPGSEWVPVIPTLGAARPAAMFLFRWNVTQNHSTIVGSLVTGINRIAACHPKGRTIVLAHSAGGVVASFAVSQLDIGPKEPAEVYTVASPLSGVGIHDKAEEQDGEYRFLRDLGGTKTGFAAAAPNVFVTHFRTHYPADDAMAPRFGREPNLKGIGVAGATEIDLPQNLTHDGSLLFVAKQLLEGAR